MGIGWLWSKQRAVKCPDGTTQYVYKDIDDAFPYFFKEAKMSAAAALDGLKKVKGKIDAKYESKITNILAQIDEKNGSIQTHLRAAYVLYSSAPCKKLDSLEAAIGSIRQDEKDLRAAELAIKQLTAILSKLAAGPAHPVSTQLGDQLGQIIASLSSQSPAGMLVREMIQVQENANQWRKP